MKTNMKSSNIIAIAAMATMLFTTPALSHSFNVTLVLPGSTAQSPQARQIHQGFMLATTERDGHPDEESDGHLGGLDVYVTVAEKNITKTDDVDIVIALGKVKIPVLSDNATALLTKGKTPFSKTELTAVKRFISTYKARYGMTPSADAAQGYNAARRVEIAVRAQGEADDKALLNESFKKTARNFNW